MSEPDTNDSSNTNDLELTVRQLREQNAKLIQLLRSQGLLSDSSGTQNGKAADVNSSIPSQSTESSSITFDHSDFTCTTNSTNTTNQIHNQYVNNHGPVNQQNFGGQTVHGNQSNVTPNFNTVIQSTTQPIIQNNSNTLVQNNTNVIQPINLVNFNNLSLDSIQSFFASQNGMMYLPQTSSATNTTTTTSTSVSLPASSTITNSNGTESLKSTAHNILPTAPTEQLQNPVSDRPKQSLLHPLQELIPVIPKIRAEQYESIVRQYSSSSSPPYTTIFNNDASNSLDNDSNDSKQKYPRPIRPKPSSRTHSLKINGPMAAHHNKIPSNNSAVNAHSAKSNNSHGINNIDPSPTVSLFSSSSDPSSGFNNNYLKHSIGTSNDHMDQGTSMVHSSSSIELSVSQTNHILPKPSSSIVINHNSTLSNLTSTKNKKSSKTRLRNVKKASESSTIIQTSINTPISIAPNKGRPLAPATLNGQRSATSNNPITKRSNQNKKLTKRQSKSLIQSQSESSLPNSGSPSSAFAESISGFLETFNQELLESNILLQSASIASLDASIAETATSNILADETDSFVSSNTNPIRSSFDNIDFHNLVNGTIQHQDSYHSMTESSDTFDDLRNRTEHPNLGHSATNNLQHSQDLNGENEPITALMTEEDMRFVEMNFDENVFLKQFDLEDSSIKLNSQSDQSLFANLLNNTNPSQSEISTAQIQMHRTTMELNSTSQLAFPSPPSLYSGSSLINNSVFTTVVPLGSQQPTCQSSFIMSASNATHLIPQEGVQLTARHIEPRQVATYESAKYQDILDDLVMVTDQDVLSHAQAEAASDPSIISTDFTLALIEATNEVMKETNIQVLEGITNAFSEVQYIYPNEHEQEPTQQQIEHISQDRNMNVDDEQSSMSILHELQTELFTDMELTKETVNETTENSTINDISSLLQMDSCLVSPQKIITSETPTIATEDATETAVSSESVVTDLVTPIRSTKTTTHITVSGSPTREVLQIDYNTLLRPEFPVEKITLHFDHSTIASYSPVSRGSELKSVENIPELDATDSNNPVSRSSIVFEAGPPPAASKSPIIRESQEIIVDSGCLKQFECQEMQSPCQYVDIDDLLFEKPVDPYDLIEQHVINSPMIDPKRNENDQSMEDVTSTNENSKEITTFVRTYHRYQEKYLLKLKRDREKSSTIPTVKLKLHSICESHKISKNKSKRKFPTNVSKQALISPPLSFKMTTPVTTTNSESICPPTNIKQDIDQPQERPRLKITIRTKLLPPPSVTSSSPKPDVELKQSPVTLTAITTTAVKSTKEKQEVTKSRKNKKKSHHGHSSQQSKKKPLVNRSETEYAGLTRFERPLAEMYHQQTVPVSEAAGQKTEANSPSTPSVSSNELTFVEKPVMPHSGFMIDEQTPPSSITSMDHRNSPQPLPSVQTKIETDDNDNNHSHVCDHDNPQDQVNNNTFITPPPDIDLYPQHLKTHSLDTILSQSNSSQENMLSNRKSSVTSTASSKSLPTINYGIDAEALEPVSPTPITPSPSFSIATKMKHGQKTPSSASSTLSSNTVESLNYRDLSPHDVDHHQHSYGHSQPMQYQQQSQVQHRSSKEHHASSKKSSSSRSSKPETSHNHTSSRPITNHHHRPPQEFSTTTPILPSTLPPPSSSFHSNPYATPYHHFAARAGPSTAFFNFPLPNPYLNHHTTVPPPTHFHHPHHAMKYHHHNHHGTHAYPNHHQSSFSYHSHMSRQQQYHGSNYMSTRDHHPFDR